jgi:hypothetical protein
MPAEPEDDRVARFRHLCDLVEVLAEDSETSARPGNWQRVRRDAEKMRATANEMCELICEVPNERCPPSPARAASGTHPVGGG